MGLVIEKTPCTAPAPSGEAQGLADFANVDKPGCRSYMSQRFWKTLQGPVRRGMPDIPSPKAPPRRIDR
jgi:hypothetical protein